MPLTRFPRLTAMALALTLLGAGLPQGAFAQDAPDQPTSQPALGLSGAYLAARVAESDSDFRAAAGWYDTALVADPGNTQLMQGALYAQLSLGNYDRALELAQALGVGTDDANSNQLGGFAFVISQALAEDYDTLIAEKGAGREIGPVLDDLVTAWAKVGTGKMTEALADFDTIAEMRGMQSLGLYHKAMALAVAGDFEGAEAILSGKTGGPVNLNRRGIIALAQIMSQLEHNTDALAMLDKAFGNETEPAIDALRARLQAGEPVPFDQIPSAKAGIAEVFFTVATLLKADNDPAFVLLHSRAANALDPANAEALLLTANALEDMGQYDLAAEAFASFPKDDPIFYSAEIGRAEALYSSGKKEAAIEVLQALALSHGDLVAVQNAYAEALRREERCPESVAAYDAALALVADVSEAHWPLYFYRGTCHERLNNWDKAEADFRRALELKPNQPQVLNYLGYSLVDRGLKLDEALAMIQQAVRQEPRAGYIIDSLAWAYFRLGRYDDALLPMERASLLEPADAVVTDHLGDVYWMVGRKREADFQWRRALSFEPTEKDATRIRLKLEIGLDAVMKDERAGALKPSDAGVDDN